MLKLRKWTSSDEAMCPSRAKLWNKEKRRKKQSSEKPAGVTYLPRRNENIDLDGPCHLCNSVELKQVSSTDEKDSDINRRVCVDCYKMFHRRVTILLGRRVKVAGMDTFAEVWTDPECRTQLLPTTGVVDTTGVMTADTRSRNEVEDGRGGIINTIVDTPAHVERMCWFEG